MDETSIGLRDYLAERLDRQDKVLGEIRSEVRATNGRVSKLETLTAVLNERMPANPKRDIAVGGLGAFVAGAGWFLWEKLTK